MRYCFLAVMLCLIGARLLAAEPTTEDLIRQLQDVTTKVAKDKIGPAGSGRGSEIAPYISQYITSIREGLTRGDINSVRQSTAEIQSLLPSEEILKISDALLENAQKNLASQQQAYIQSIDSAVDEAVKASFAAKEPKDLDVLIIRLTKEGQRQDYNSAFEPSQRSAEKARAAVTFMCRWQDYLMQKKSGNNAAAASVLKSLAQDSSSYPFVSRSEILSRMQPLVGIVDARGEAVLELPDLAGKKLGDIGSLKSTTRELVFRNSNSQSLRQFYDQLTALDRACQQLKAGMVGQAVGYCTERGGNKIDEAFQPLRQALLLEALPIYLDTTKDYPVTEADTPTEYLLRIVREARAKGDWVTAWKTLEAYRQIAFNDGQNPAWLGSDIQGISQFIVAQNLDKAGEYRSAIKTYKNVLFQPGENVPVKEATERLNVLKKDHPEDYEAATQPADSSAGRTYPSR